MDCPCECHQPREDCAFAFAHAAGAGNERLRAEEKRDRGGRVQEDAREMVAPRLEGEQGVIECIGEPLDRAVEIGCGRVGEKKMAEAFRDEAPAPDERVTQDERGVVPDELVLQRRPVNGERHGDEGEDCYGVEVFLQAGHHGSLQGRDQAWGEGRHLAGASLSWSLRAGKTFLATSSGKGCLSGCGAAAAIQPKNKKSVKRY